MNRLLPILAIAMLAAGCAAPPRVPSSGPLALHSAENPEKFLRGSFETAVYRYESENTLDVLLIDGTPDDPVQVVHIRMLWLPAARRTPLSARATNATVRYVVFTGKAAGIYEGAGFLQPRSTVGDRLFRGELRSSDLRLTDHTFNFRDRLGAALAAGTFEARHDELAAQRLMRHLRLKLRQELGFPRFVEADVPPTPALADLQHP